MYSSAIGIHSVQHPRFSVDSDWVSIAGVIWLMEEQEIYDIYKLCPELKPFSYVAPRHCTIDKKTAIDATKRRKVGGVKTSTPCGG